MNENTRRLLTWTPRILCIAFAGFLTLFATDVFDMRLDFWHTALALLMHLIPTIVVLVVLAIVWRREWVGAVLFPLLAVFHLVTKRGTLDWAGYAMVDGPLLVMGLLFLLGWRNRPKHGPTAR